MIKHPNRISQVIDFSGVGNNKIHPTDIDAVFEFNNKYLILIEVKHINNPVVPCGQAAVYERITDAWQATNGDAFFLTVVHGTKTDEFVNLKNTFIYETYHKGKYTRTNETYRKNTLINFLLRFASHYKISKLYESIFQSL